VRRNKNAYRCRWSANSATLIAEAVAGLVADGLDTSHQLRTPSTSPRRTATADLLHPMPSVAKFIGDIRQDLTQDFALAPSLKAAMRRLEIWIALQQHMPLRASVHNP
jgi:hypothetical protein